MLNQALPRVSGAWPGATADVARRQSDGTWLWMMDRPNVLAYPVTQHDQLPASSTSFSVARSFDTASTAYAKSSSLIPV